MWLRSSHALILALAGCHTVFGLTPLPDAAGDEVPVQQVTAQAEHESGGPPRPFPVPRTTAGNTLVLVVAIATGYQHVGSVIDNGQNLWLRAVDGPDSELTTAVVRLEVWFAPAAKATDEVTVLFSPADAYRAIAVNFSEWRGNTELITGRATPAVTVAGDMPATTLNLTERGLVIAAMSTPTNLATATLETADFGQLQMFVGNKPISGAAAYLAAEPAIYDVTWKLSSPQLWSAGIMALRRLP